MASKRGGGFRPMYPPKNNGSKAALKAAADKAAMPTTLGNCYGVDGMNPVERQSQMMKSEKD